MPHRAWLLVLPLLAAGCAGRERPVAIAVAPPPPVAVSAPMPEGASPGMLVPTPLPDGSYPTPNRALSAAGTVWHLRAGLNVAALSCPGEQGAAIRAGYNGWLMRQKAVLARVAPQYAAEYGAATPAARASFDDAMTRLYNFFSQTPVRPAFCAAAASVIGEVAGADAASLPAVATAGLATLDRPFAAFYRDYDAWRRGAPAQPVIAIAAVTATGPAPTRPRLVLDLSDLPDDAAVTAC